MKKTNTIKMTGMCKYCGDDHMEVKACDAYTKQEKETYETLLNGAPEHHSQEFLLYLMNNNTAVADLGSWLVIENCKYHNQDRKWYTAFYKGSLNEPAHDIDELFIWAGDGMAVFQNPKMKRSVTRTHYHITPMQTPGDEN